MKNVTFGFVVHPLSSTQRRILAVRTLRPSLFFQNGASQHDPSSISRIKTRSVDGQQLQGHIVAIAPDQHQLLADQATGVEQITEGVEVCASKGASVVGLGAVAGIIGGQGKAVSKQTSIPVTTGHTTTAWAAAETAELVLHQSPTRLELTLIGAPGSVANGILLLLVSRGHRVRIFSPEAPKPLIKRINALNSEGPGAVQIVKRLADAAGKGRLTIAASSTGGKLKLSKLPSGSLIIDVAAPQDVTFDCKIRKDVLVLDGEYLRTPESLTGFWQSIYGHVTHQTRNIFACFAEPMILAIAQAQHLAHVGRTTSLDRLCELGHLAITHGFLVDRLYSRGVPLREGRWTQFWENAQK